MKNSDQFDAQAFSIQTERVVIEGDTYFKATAQEFPHLEIYEETPSSAYEVIIQSIQDLHAAAVADERPFPTSSKTDDESQCSGRVTLRMSKSLHRRLLNQARCNGVPLNTEIVTQLSQTSVLKDFQDQMMAKLSASFAPKHQLGMAHIFAGHESANVVNMHIEGNNMSYKPLESVFSIVSSVASTSKFLSDDPSFHEEMGIQNLTSQYGSLR